MNLSKAIVVGMIGAVFLSSAAFADEPTARERLLAAEKISVDLQASASALPGDMAKMLGIVPEVPEDRAFSAEKRFARLSEVNAYLRGRPWSTAYEGTSPRQQPVIVPTDFQLWPAERDAASLRELLADKDGAIRSLAVEALGALDLPEDVPRIAAMLQDQAAGAPVLGWSLQISQMGWESQDADPLQSDRTWHPRTVQTYVRQALCVMTGYRFDGNNPSNITFEQWWKTHDLGKESYWYWKQRLAREHAPVIAIDMKEWQSDGTLQKRITDAADVQRAKLHAATLAEINQLSREAQAKIYLISGEEVEVTGPINPYFPDGFPPGMGYVQLMGKVDGTGTWPDCDDVPFARAVMLARIARLSPQLLAGAGAPPVFRARIRAALEKEAPKAPWMPVLASRLLPPADLAIGVDDPRTGEGYLRQKLAAATDGYARDQLAQEMVRSNLQGQWPALEKVFYADGDKQWDGSDARKGILQALGEEPHTPEKLRVLTALIDDPRNEILFTQENLRMGMDMYRFYAVRSLNAIAQKKVVPWVVLQDLGTPGRSKAALEELRRTADEMLKGTK